MGAWWCTKVPAHLLAVLTLIPVHLGEILPCIQDPENRITHPMLRKRHEPFTRRLGHRREGRAASRHPF